MLNGVRVLVHEPDPALREPLTEVLIEEGAIVGSESEPGEPDAMLVSLPQGDGALPSRFERLLGVVPAIATTTALRVELDDLHRRGFQKVLRKPFDLDDAVRAVASVLPSLEDSLRSTLAVANARTSYRYTALFRFDDDDALTSLWTFDREHPGVDGFPLNMRVEDSYCRFVRGSGQPVVVTDSANDPRVVGHPKREVLRSYCGVPVRSAAGTIVGSLCHFDPEPRPVTPRMVTQLEELATTMRPTRRSSR